MMMYLACGWRYNPKSPPRRPPQFTIVPARLRKFSKLWKEVACAGPAVASAGKRQNWEFMVVLEGRQKLLAQTGKPPLNEPFQSHSMWICPPGSDHGWIVPPGESSWIFVMHFASIPPSLEQVLSGTKYGYVKFCAEEGRRLKELLFRVVPHYHNPVFASSLYFQAALCELSAFYIEHSSLAKTPTFDDSARKVAQVMTWFRENLSNKASVSAAASSIGVSPGYLQRLFVRELGRPPKVIFKETVMERARELLLQSNLSRKEVATLCGFEGFSQFYRAFHRFHGNTPSEWVKGKMYGASKTLPMWARKEEKPSEN
jgi:AraC-like DNA-binding protein